VTRLRVALLTLTSSSSEVFLSGPLVDSKEVSLSGLCDRPGFFRSINGFTPSERSARSTVSHGIPIFRIPKH
jgi:hypothetical protein